MCYIQYHSARSIFYSSRGVCLTVEYLLGEALNLFVLGFPSPETGQMFGCCLGSFVRGKALLRVYKWSHVGHNGRETEIPAHILGTRNFCAQTVSYDEIFPGNVGVEGVKNFLGKKNVS